MRGLLFVAGLCLSGCLAAPPAGAPVPAGDAAASREQAGVLARDAVWSGEVVMTGDVLVPAGRTLVVAPGTVVRVRPSESTRIDPEYLSPETELLVRGTLRVAGTPEAPVRFVVDGNGTWAGIALVGAAGSAVEHAEIEKAETGVLCVACSPLLAGNRIDGGRYGIIVQQGGAPRILDNRIADGEGGVFCWGGARPYLKGNHIAGHEEEGIFVERGSRPYLDRNRVTGNDIGVALGDPGLPLDATGVTGNRRDVLVLGEPAL